MQAAGRCFATAGRVASETAHRLVAAIDAAPAANTSSNRDCNSLSDGRAASSSSRQPPFKAGSGVPIPLTAYAGAGIVAGSDPEAELLETRVKFRPIVDALA